jgi:2-keto-3-deoxy-L-rhamnonate aldolase RhmA
MKTQVAVRMMQMGFRFVVLSSDSGILLRAAKSDVQIVQSARSESQGSGKSNVAC